MPPSLRTLLRTPTFKNSGSTARDHLASERTLLAWLRTGLGFVALGIAVERFSQFELELAQSPASFPLPQQSSSPSPLATPQTAGTGAEQENPATAKVKRTQQHAEREQVLVATLLGTGVGGIVYGAARYFSNLVLLQQGLFKPAYKGAAGMGLCVAGLAGVAWWGMVKEEESAIEHRMANQQSNIKGK